ncbi:MAG: hypothetical protein FWH41_02830 [Treponema sp.]|nr:hypothetical protein [Treponema sp.]
MKETICTLIMAALLLNPVMFLWGEDEDLVKIYKVYDLDKAPSGVPKAAGYTDEDDKIKKDENNKPFSETFNGLTVYFFDGFDFKKYHKSHPGLEELTNYAIDAIIHGVSYSYLNEDKKEVKAVTQAAGPYSIIAHSQGGMRALGYLTMLEKRAKAYNIANPLNTEENPYRIDDIDAVITVSGIDQGLQTLKGGLPELVKKLNKKADIIGKGLKSVSVASVDLTVILFLTASITGPIVTTLLLIVGSAVSLVGLAVGIAGIALTDARLFVLMLIPEPMRPYFLDAWLNPKPANFAQISDMAPESSYIKDYIITEKKMNKVKTGTKRAYEWRTKTVGKRKVKYLWSGKVDVFKYVTETRLVPQFNENVPLGFIVGANNNTLGMGGKDKEDIANKVIKGFKAGFVTAQALHIAKCAGLIGLFTGSPKYANDANNARKFCNNIKAEISGLLGTTKGGDGLVATENQHISKSLLENPLLGTTDELDYVKMEHHNHVSIFTAEETYEKAGKMIDQAIKIKEKRKK